MKPNVFDSPVLGGVPLPEAQATPQPQSAVPKPLIDPASAMMGMEMPDPYEVAKPTHLSLMKTAAAQTGTHTQLDTVMQAAYKGLTPQQMAMMREQQAIDRKVEEVLAKTADIPDDKFREIMGKMDAIGAQMRGRKPPTMRKPEYDWASGIGTGLAMLIDPEGAGTYAGQFGAAMKNRANEVLEMDQAEFEAESDALEMEYRLTQEQLRRQADLDEQLRRSAREGIERELRVLAQQGASLDKKMQFMQGEISKAWSRYNGANMPEEKRFAAAVLEGLGVQIDREAVERDANQLAGRNSQAARNAFAQQVNQLRDDFGEVPETAVAQLEAQKREIAAMYGVSVDLFPPIPTGQTLAKQRFEQSKAQFDRLFTQRDEQFKQRVAQFNANLTLAKQRIAIMQQNANTSAGGLTLRGQTFEYRKIRDAAQGMETEFGKELQNVSKELATTRGILKQYENSGLKVPFVGRSNQQLIADTQKKIQKLEAEEKALKALIEQAQEEANAASEALGEGNPLGGLPNPGALQTEAPPPLSGNMATAPSGGNRGGSTTKKTTAKPGAKGRTVKVNGVDVVIK